MNRKVQNTIEIPQLHHTDDVLVVLVVQVPLEQVVSKTAEIPQLPFVKKIGVIPETAELLSDVQVPQVRVVAQTVEIPQSLFGEKIAAIPEVLFHAGMKRTMKCIAQQPVASNSSKTINHKRQGNQYDKRER